MYLGLIISHFVKEVDVCIVKSDRYMKPFLSYLTCLHDLFGDMK